MREDVARRCFGQVASALAYLHNCLGVIHRDIKADNVLLDHNGNAKLIDFGFGRADVGREPQVMSPRGSPAYVAPEVIQRAAYSYGADIYSAGVLLFLMATGRLPFDGEEDVDATMRSTVTRDVDLEGVGTPELVDLLRGMLSRDAASRLTADGVVRHPWLRGCASMPYDASVPYAASEPDDDIVGVLCGLGYDRFGVIEEVATGRFDSPICGMYRILECSGRERAVREQVLPLCATARAARGKVLLSQNRKGIGMRLPGTTRCGHGLGGGTGCFMPRGRRPMRSPMRSALVTGWRAAESKAAV